MSDRAEHGAGAGEQRAAWPAEVDVRLKRAGVDPQFEITSSLPRNAAGDLIFENNGRPGFVISFNLIDQSGGNYLFPSRAHEAVWSAKGTQCPRSPAHQVFEPLRVAAQGKTLVVRNDNPGPDHGGPIGPFRYSLRATNDDGVSYLLLDPGGENMNGSRM